MELSTRPQPMRPRRRDDARERLVRLRKGGERTDVDSGR